MRANVKVLAAVLVGSLSLAGCAGDGSLMGPGITTQSIEKKSKVDPVCVALQARIDQLKSEGTVGRVEKAATGKSKNVVIKRASLGKVAELNQANSEFVARCSKLKSAKKPVVARKTADASAAVAAVAKAKAKDAKTAAKGQVAKAAAKAATQ